MSRTCDCGRVKERPRAAACEWCAFLDGASPAEQVLIGILRAHGGCATMAILALETGWSERHLQRQLAKLRRLRRIVAVRTGEDEAYPFVYWLVDRRDARAGAAP